MTTVNRRRFVQIGGLGVRFGIARAAVVGVYETLTRTTAIDLTEAFVRAI